MRILVLLATLSLFGATITVTNNNDTGPGSLRQAIADASTGDTIDFGISSQTITFGSAISIGASEFIELTIEGGGNNVTLSGTTLFDVANFSSLYFEGFTGTQINGNLTESGDGGTYGFYDPGGDLTIAGNLTGNIYAAYLNNQFVSNTISFTGTISGLDLMNLDDGGGGESNGPELTFSNVLTATQINFETGVITAPSLNAEVLTTARYIGGSNEGGRLAITSTYTQAQTQGDTENNADFFIGAEGSFVKTGSFKMSTSQAQPNFLGDYIIQAGTVEFQTVSSYSATLESAASLQIGDNGTATVSVTNFSFPDTVSGEGTLNLGANQTLSTPLTSFTGNINVTAGTTTFTASNSIANTNTLTVSEGAAVAIGASSFTYPTSFAGDGALSFSSSNALNTQLSSFSGSVSVTGGTLTLNDQTSLNETSSLAISESASVVIADTAFNFPSTISGAGTVGFGANFSLGEELDSFSGTISAESGTLTLSSPTSIPSASTLNIENEAVASIGSESFTFPSAITGAGTLSIGADNSLASQATAFTGDISITAGTLSATATDTFENVSGVDIGESGTFSVNIASFDFPTITGSGTVAFGATQSIGTEVNDFTGGIAVTSGTVSFTNEASINNADSLAISSGATASIAVADFNFPSTLSGSGTIAFAGNQTLTTALTNFPGNVSVTSGTLSLNSATALENANALAIASGTTASFSQASPSLPTTSGTGNLTFGASAPIGSNTAAFAGTMNVTGGTLNIAGTTAVQNTATLAVSNGATASFTAANTTMPTAITGAGTLAFSTNQTLTAAPSAFTGGLSVTAGTLSVGATTAIQNAASLAISDGATASFTAANTTMPTAITGDGTLRLASTQTLATQASNFTGAVALTSGTATFSNASSLANAASLAISDGATANVNATSFTYPATITGSGTFGFSQNLSLGTQLSSFTGKVRNTSGTLTISETTSLENAASLTIDTGATTALSTANTTLPPLLGSGTLSIASDQTLTNDAPSFTGTVAIASDTTFLNNDLSGASATVASGATLRGAGTINDLTINGVLFPGNSIGTMTVLGNYTQAAGSELQVEIAPDGTADLIDATGTATIGSDTTLTIIPEAGSYASSLVFTIIDADGGVSGEFTNVELDNTSGASIGTLTATYLANQVQLTLGQSVTAFCNSQSYLIANGLTLGNRFQYGILSDQNVQRIVTDQVSCNPTTQPYRTYLSGDYANGHTDNMTDQISSKYLFGGTQVGVEKVLDRGDVIVGGLFGYTRYKSESYNRCSFVNSNDYTLGLYGEKYFEKWIVDGSVLYTLFDFHSDRHANNAKQNDADFFGSGVSAHVKGSYLGRARALHVIPSLGLDYYYNYGSPYRENNIAATRYNVSSTHFNNLFADLGLRILLPIKTNSRVTLLPQISASWLQNLTTTTHNVKYKNTNSINPWSSFTISSLNDHALTLSSSLTASIASCISLSALAETTLASTYAPTAAYRLSLRYTY